MSKNVTLEQLADKLTTLLPKLLRCVAKHENNYLTNGEITIKQMILLECLLEKGESTMSDLAGDFSLGSSSVTGLMDRLIKQDLATRVRSQEDRRVVRVDITEKGRNILEEIHKQKREGLKELFKPLSADERVEYLRIVKKLVDELADTSGVEGNE